MRNYCASDLLALREHQRKLDRAAGMLIALGFVAGFMFGVLAGLLLQAAV